MMNQNIETKSENSAMQIRMRIMMGIGIAIPLMLYYMGLFMWRSELKQKEYPVTEVALLILLSIAVLFVFYIVDIIKVSAQVKRISATAILIVLFILFQPAYFWYRQSILEQPKKSGKVYMFVGILLPIVLIVLLVFQAAFDFGSMFIGFGATG